MFQGDLTSLLSGIYFNINRCGLTKNRTTDPFVCYNISDTFFKTISLSN